MRVVGDMTANAISTSHKGNLMRVLMERHFSVYAESAEEALSALKGKCSSEMWLLVSDGNPRRVQCAKIALNDEERKFIRDPKGKAGSIIAGTVIAPSSTIIETRPLGSGEFPADRLLYPAA